MKDVPAIPISTLAFAGGRQLDWQRWAIWWAPNNPHTRRRVIHKLAQHKNDSADHEQRSSEPPRSRSGASLGDPPH